jgi:protein required for attachment to host cells
MLGINKDTWVVVANGSECKIFFTNNNGKIIKLLKALYSADSHLQAAYLGVDKPGRIHESNIAARHAIEPKADLHDKEKTKFSNLIVNYLNNGIKTEEFKHLILIASPEFLGEIRKKISKRIALMITREINKDLTHANDAKILETLLC